MNIELTTASRIADVDFENLTFGTNFSDHMLVCKYKNGQWQTPEILPFKKMDFSLGLHALHYGQAAFEGQKAYYTKDGNVAIFRPEANWERLNKSAERLLMPKVPKEVFVDGLLKLIEIDKKWVPNHPERALYIRPFMFSSSEFIAARPSEEYIFAIINSPVGAYYSGAVKVKIEDHYSRSMDGGIGFTKAAGNYGGAFFPTAKAIEEGYNQIAWTDHKEHKFLEEAGTMNLMVVIGDTLITPPLSDRILAGITRDSILTLARDWGWKVEERRISVDEVVEAYENGELKEAFGTGTAAVVSPICEFGYKGKKMEVPTPKDGFAAKIKKGLNDIRLGVTEDKFDWMRFVK